MLIPLVVALVCLAIASLLVVVRVVAKIDEDTEADASTGVAILTALVVVAGLICIGITLDQYLKAPPTHAEKCP